MWLNWLPWRFFIRWIARYGGPPRELEDARALIEGLGWEGVPVYVAVFIAGSVLLAPATALSAIAPILFGTWLDFLAILIGNMAATASMFALVLGLGRIGPGLGASSDAFRWG
jgi:uncharacterized membrane protein YdjX (TVP38/TMEM64 family)